MKDRMLIKALYAAVVFCWFAASISLCYVCCDPNSAYDSCALNFLINDSYSSPCFECGVGSNQYCCKTLMDALSAKRGIQCPKYYHYYLPPGNHLVWNSSFTSFTFAYAALHFYGQNSIITCADSGWKFADITDKVILKDVAFENCHSTHPSNTKTTETMTTTQVGLYFSNCKSVDLTSVRVTFTNPTQAVCVYLNNPGRTNVSSSSFINGTNGIILALSTQSGNLYTIEKSNFMNNNSSLKPHLGPTTIPSDQDFNEFNKGGGILIVVKGYASSNEFQIINCQFSQNQAQYGGGLFASFLNQTSDNYLLVRRSKFWGNACPFTSESKTYGGGIYIESLASKLQQKFVLEMNSLVQNKAFTGGAVYITVLNSSQSNLIISDTNFTKNSARFGSAIYVDQATQLQGSIGLLVLKGDVFQTNSIDYPENMGVIATTGLGAVFSKNINIQFQGSACFEGNKGSALVVVDAVAKFTSCGTTFVNNYGTRGGAIALLGDSYMLVSHSGMNMTFQDNSATFEGGAIYKQYPNDPHARYGSKCFVECNNGSVELDPARSTFEFSNNRVLSGPRSNSIHTTSIESCMIPGNPDGTPLCWDNWKFDNKTIISNHVTTDFNATLSFIRKFTGSFPISPGWPFEVPLISRDYFGNDINNNINAFILSHDGGNASLSPEDNMSVHAGLNRTIQVEFESLQDRSMHFKLEVHMTACPPGFVYNNDSKNCTCHQGDHYGLHCYEDRKVATLLNDMWVGMLNNDGVYYVGSCPVHFCALPESKLRLLPNSSGNLSGELCWKNRSGVLCGECERGYCLAVNSWAMNCVKNTTQNATWSNVMVYISTVYLPFFVILSLLALCHVKLMAGPMHAFVLFSQMIVTSFDLTEHDRIPLQKPVLHFPNVYRFIYGPFNLDFLEKHVGQVCFSSEFNALSLLVLEYLLLLVPAFMVVIGAICICVFKIVKRQQVLLYKENIKEKLQKLKFIRIVQKSLSETVVLLLCTLALLSYSKLSIASAMILFTSKLHTISSKDSSTARRVFIAGQFPSNDSRYTFYKVAASFGEVYVLILIVLLLDYPLRLIKLLINKTNALRRHKFIAITVRAIESFANEFQASFRPNFRFFAGFYFMFRYAISIVYLRNHSSILKYLVQELTCIAMILLLVVCKPHRETIHNVADISIFTNLAVINALNLYLNDLFLLSDKKYASGRVFFLQFVLALAPVVVLLMCVCWRHTRSHVKHFLKKYVFKNRIIVLDELIQSAAHADTEEAAKENSSEVIGEAKPLPISNNNAPKGRSAKFDECGTAVLPPQSQKCDGACSVGNPCSGADGIPVTFVDVYDKGMGEACTSQSRLSEGYYLKREWSSAGCNMYGAINS